MFLGKTENKNNGDFNDEYMPAFHFDKLDGV